MWVLHCDHESSGSSTLHLQSVERVRCQGPAVRAPLLRPSLSLESQPTRATHPWETLGTGTPCDRDYLTMSTGSHLWRQRRPGGGRTGVPFRRSDDLTLKMETRVEQAIGISNKSGWHGADRLLVETEDCLLAGAYDALDPCSLRAQGA